MTKEEFMEKFGDGKTKIDGSIWNCFWVIPSSFGSGAFAGVNEVDNLCIRNYPDSDWPLYKEPKPEFDFDKPYMWAESMANNEIYLFAKSSFLTWGVLFGTGASGGNWSQKEIKEMCVPTTQPDNYRDYGLQEKDLISE